jgi:hypothetical protein
MTTSRKNAIAPPKTAFALIPISADIDRAPAITIKRAPTTNRKPTVYHNPSVIRAMYR